MNVDSFKFLIVAGCFFISLGVIEIIDNRPFAKWPHLQKYERISSADFHYSDGAYRIGTISVESFKYGRLRFGGTKLWRFGELSLDKTQFRFHLPAQRRALLGCTLDNFSRHTNKTITVFYGPATNFLDSLFLPAHKKGEWGTKIYAVETSFRSGDFGMAGRVYEAAERMRTIVYACFSVGAFLLYRAYRRFKSQKAK